MSPEIKYFKVGEWKCLSTIKAFLSSPHTGFFSIVDASKILSVEQVEISYSRALRIVENSDRIKRAESAFLMLLSGQTQISKAQAEAGISSSTDNVLVVYDNPSDLESCIRECDSNLLPVEESLVPYSDRSKDNTVFSRMARVELSL